MICNYKIIKFVPGYIITLRDDCMKSTLGTKGFSIQSFENINGSFILFPFVMCWSTYHLVVQYVHVRLKLSRYREDSMLCEHQNCEKRCRRKKYQIYVLDMSGYKTILLPPTSYFDPQHLSQLKGAFILLNKNNILTHLKTNNRAKILIFIL